MSRLLLLLLCEFAEACVTPGSQNDPQQEPVQIHDGTGNSLACHSLFHQGRACIFALLSFQTKEPR
jgi:hypothetical protein